MYRVGDLIRAGQRSLWKGSPGFYRIEGFQLVGEVGFWYGTNIDTGEYGEGPRSEIVTGFGPVPDDDPSVLDYRERFGYLRSLVSGRKYNKGGSSMYRRSRYGARRLYGSFLRRRQGAVRFPRRRQGEDINEQLQNVIVEAVGSLASWILSQGTSEAERIARQFESQLSADPDYGMDTLAGALESACSDAAETIREFARDYLP